MDTPTPPRTLGRSGGLLLALLVVATAVLLTGACRSLPKPKLEQRLLELSKNQAFDELARTSFTADLGDGPQELELVYRLRKVLADMNVVEAMELLKSRLLKCKTNAEFLLTMNLD